MEKLESILDTSFDIILYTIIAISFLGAGTLMVLEVVNAFSQDSNLLPTITMIAIGIILSGFLYWIKSIGKAE